MRKFFAILGVLTLGSLSACKEAPKASAADEHVMVVNASATLQKSWNGPDAVSYYISTNVPDEFVPVIVDAFQDWESATGRSLFVYEGRTDATKSWDGKNVVSWNAAGDGQGHLGMTYRKFSGTRILEADIVIFENPSKYAVLACPDTEENCQVASGHYDIKTNLLHEIGHFVGLEHTEEAGSIMNPHYGLNTVVHHLDEDLVSELQDVYGTYLASN